MLDDEYFKGIKAPELRDLSNDELLDAIVDKQRQLLRDQTREQLLRMVVSMRVAEEQARLMESAGIDPNPYGGLFKFLNGE